VLHFHAEETLLELAHLFKVGNHVDILRLVSFVEEVDDELGVALDSDALDAEGDGSPEPGEEAFILYDVVGDLVRLALEIELHGIVELSLVPEVSMTPAPAP
jgi:hypothetical protein